MLFYSQYLGFIIESRNLKLTVFLIDVSVHMEESIFCINVLEYKLRLNIIGGGYDSEEKIKFCIS